jgi:hypothetical protein
MRRLANRLTDLAFIAFGVWVIARLMVAAFYPGEF